jgi:hypothetical protein
MDSYSSDGPPASDATSAYKRASDSDDASTCAGKESAAGSAKSDCEGAFDWDEASTCDNAFEWEAGK